MFEELNKDMSERLKDLVEIDLTPKEGWEAELRGSWSSIPTFIVARIGRDSQNLFECYTSIYDSNLDLTRLKPTKWTGGQDKSLVHFYLGLAMVHMEKLARSYGSKRILFDTQMSFIYDHIMDLGYKLVPKTAYSDSIMAYKELR